MEGLDGAFAGFKESVALVAVVPLLDADEALEAGLAEWLLLWRNGAVVVGFVCEEDDGDKDDADLDREDPVWPPPGNGVDHESAEHWTNERRDDKGESPDVDLTRMLVKEEDVLDAH